MYTVNAKVFQQVMIDKEQIAKILEEERAKLLGSNDRYIEDGIIYEEYKYHTWHKDKIREATEEEIETYEALNKVIRYFKK